MSSSPNRFADPFDVLQTPSGVQVHLHQTRKYKAVHVGWYLERPLDEGRSARALTADLLTRATAGQPGMAAFAARCEDLYATDVVSSVSGFGPAQVVRFGIETVADRYAGGRPLFDEATSLLAECLHDPPLIDGRLRPDHLAQEQANLVHAVEALADDKPGHAFRRLMETMHAGAPHALHPWGTVEDARGLDEASVRAAWSDLVGRAPARLFIVGDVDEAVALRTAEKLAGPGPRDALPASHRPPTHTRQGLQEVIEREQLNQSRLAMGFQVPAELLEGQASNMFALVFGGGSHSRLFKRIREAEGLAYGCGAALLKDSAALVVQAGVDAGNVGRARELVLEELDRLVQDGVAEDELELSRRDLLRRLESLSDSPRGQSYFRLTALMSGRTHAVEEVMGQVRAVTPADVVRVAGALALDSVFVLEGQAA